MLCSLSFVAGCGSGGVAANQDTVAETSFEKEPAEVTETTIGAPVATPAPTSPAIAAPPPIPIAPPEGMTLVWSDEFDGDTIDLTNWTYDIGGWGWGNGEAQYYTDRIENARLANGLLTIEARQEQYDGSGYTSARLKTQGLQSFQYGRFEARIKVPRGAGTWPAFWMLGADFDRDEDAPTESNWPNVGEIDIMEHLGREPDLVFGTVHGPGYSGALGLTKWLRQDEEIADDFHVYAVEWDTTGIRWFHDEEVYYDVGPEAVGDREWVFDGEFFLILNLAVGGQLPGPIGLDVEFPLNMYVDYVRVYQPLAGTS